MGRAGLSAGLYGFCSLAYLRDCPNGQILLCSNEQIKFCAIGERFLGCRAFGFLALRICSIVARDDLPKSVFADVTNCTHSHHQRRRPALTASASRHTMAL
jgi:hypothetical protein